MVAVPISGTVTWGREDLVVSEVPHNLVTRAFAKDLKHSRVPNQAIIKQIPLETSGLSGRRVYKFIYENQPFVFPFTIPLNEPNKKSLPYLSIWSEEFLWKPRGINFGDLF